MEAWKSSGLLKSASCSQPAAPVEDGDEISKPRVDPLEKTWPSSTLEGILLPLSLELGAGRGPRGGKHGR